MFTSGSRNCIVTVSLNLLKSDIPGSLIQPDGTPPHRRLRGDNNQATVIIPDSGNPHDTAMDGVYVGLIWGGGRLSKLHYPNYLESTLSRVD